MNDHKYRRQRPAIKQIAGQSKYFHCEEKQAKQNHQVQIVQSRPDESDSKVRRQEVLLFHNATVLPTVRSRCSLEFK